MDFERAVLSSALNSGQIATLLARGIESKHFSQTSSGNEVAKIFTWAATHSRKYGVCPSLQLVKNSFPEWRGEPSSDPLEPLIDEFLNEVRRRFFESKVRELAQFQGKRDQRHRLDEVMLDAARDLAAIVPSGRVARFRAEMQERIDNYEVEKEEGTTSGIKMGIELFDQLTDGFRPGNLVTLSGFAGRGKALDLNTPVPTPEGWTTMGEITAGEYVFGADGKPTLVTKAWPALNDRKCYEINFSDGTKIVADAEHLWETYDWSARGSESRAKKRPRDQILGNDQSHLMKKPRVLTTEQILEEMKKTVRKHSIPCCNPVEYEEQDLPIDPYILGYWLGDGTSAAAQITVHINDMTNLLSELDRAEESYKIHDSSDKPTTKRISFGHLKTCQRGHELVSNEQCKQCRKFRYECIKNNIDFETNYPKTEFTAQSRLRNIEVLNDKHIPYFYLESSKKQRLALLQGLMDSDGYVSPKNGKCEIAVVNKELANNILELSLGLGLRATLTERAAKWNGREVGRVYSVSFVTDMEVCKLDRKREWIREDIGSRATHRYIDSIVEVNSRPVRCIAVAASDKKFLVGREFIATHNSTIGLHFLSHALNQEKSGLLLSLEMSHREVMERLDTMANRFSYSNLMKRSLPEDEVNKWRTMANSYSETKADLIVADKLGGCTLDRVYAEINRYKPDITCVDYVQLMKGPVASKPKHEILVEIANELKAISLSTDSVIVMVSQDQRGSAEDGSTESNMGGSIAVLQAPDIYIGMMQNDQMYEEKRMKMRLIKNRRGRRGAETDVAFEPEYMRIGPWEDNSKPFMKEELV